MTRPVPLQPVRRPAALLAALAFLLALLVAEPPPALAHPDHCQDKTEETTEEECFSEEQIAQLDDSGANLAPGEVADSGNLKLLANLPKSGPFASTAAFNSDIAFQGSLAFQGNYEGFQVTDISDPRKPQVVAQVHCPGSQNDISVYGNLVLTSTDSRRNNDTCQNRGLNAAEAANPHQEYWEGVKIFDISNPASPQRIASVETDCGSHTHTLLPDLKNDRLLVYVSSYDISTAAKDCRASASPTVANRALTARDHDKISIIEVPLKAPTKARVVAEPVLFPNGGYFGSDDGYTRQTRGCHDITVYPAKGLAAGACMGEGVIMDITDPVKPTVLSSVVDPNFAFWHSASFTNDGKRVLFTDELGGGGAPTCNPTIGPEKGADAYYDITRTSDPRFLSYFKIPRTQSNTENCVAHNGIFLPVNGRDVYVQAWYQGGVSVIDFTNKHRPEEIAWFDRGPLAAGVLGGSWSAYAYNGLIYSNDIQKGLDVLQLSDKRSHAGSRRLSRLNAQTQEPLD